MANFLSRNPLVIDTPSDTPIFLGYTKINHLEYIEYAAAGNRVEVTDKDNNIIWAGTGEATADPVWSYWSGWTQGLKVPTLLKSGGANMPAGKLLIYID